MTVTHLWYDFEIFPLPQHIHSTQKNISKNTAFIFRCCVLFAVTIEKFPNHSSEHCTYHTIVKQWHGTVKVKKKLWIYIVWLYLKFMTQKFSECSEVLGTCGWYVNTGIITGDQYGSFWALLLAEPANRRLSYWLSIENKFMFCGVCTEDMWPDWIKLLALLYLQTFRDTNRLSICAAACDGVGRVGKTRCSVNSGNRSGHFRASLKIGEKMVKALFLFVGWIVLFCSKCSVNWSEVGLTVKFTDVLVWGI